MSDSFASSHPRHYTNVPITDDDLRRALAAQSLANADPTLLLDDFIAAVEQKKDAMILPSSTAIGCVFFDSGGQRWGARLNDLASIIRVSDLAPVLAPESPPWLLGMFHIDLEIASFIDLSRFLNDAIPERRQRNIAVLVIREADTIFGFKVSRLSFPSLVEEQDLIYVAPDDTPAAFPYLLATYAPHADSDPEVARAMGILNVRLIATQINTHLEEERNPDV